MIDNSCRVWTVRFSKLFIIALLQFLHARLITRSKASNKEILTLSSQENTKRQLFFCAMVLSTSVS